MDGVNFNEGDLFLKYFTLVGGVGKDRSIAD